MNDKTIELVLRCARLRIAKERGVTLPTFHARMLEQSYTGSVGGRDVPLVMFATDVLKTLEELPVKEQPVVSERRKRHKDG